MEDTFGELLKWQEQVTGIPREQFCGKEIVRLKKLANMIDSGEVAMIENNIRVFMEAENERIWELERNNNDV